VSKPWLTIAGLMLCIFTVLATERAEAQAPPCTFVYSNSGKPILRGITAQGDATWNDQGATYPQNDLTPVTTTYPAGTFKQVKIFAYWSEIAPSLTATPDYSSIDNALCALQAYNAANPTHPVYAKLTIVPTSRQISSKTKTTVTANPPYALAVGDPNGNANGPGIVVIYEPNKSNAKNISVGGYWIPQYETYWKHFNDALASRYDTNELVSSVLVESCASVDGEPWLQPTDAASLAQMASLKPAATDAQIIACLDSGPDAYASWQYTPLDETFGAYGCLGDGTSSNCPKSSTADDTDTQNTMTKYSATLGSRIGYESNSLQGLNLTDGYPTFTTLTPGAKGGPPAHWVIYGANTSPITFQTATDLPFADMLSAAKTGILFCMTELEINDQTMLTPGAPEYIDPVTQMPQLQALFDAVPPGGQVGWNGQLCANQSTVTATQTVASTTVTQNHAIVGFTPVTGSKGAGSLSYSVMPALPAGLAMNSNSGAVTGTASVVSGASAYTVTVADANHYTAAATFTLTVNPAVTAMLMVATKTLTANVAISNFVPVTGSGGTGALSYSVSPALPAGLTMNASTGAITGAPTTTSAIATYTVTVTDTLGASAAAGFMLTVNQTLTATQVVPSITATKGVPLAGVIPVAGAGGAGALGYVTLPALPAGLMMNGTTGMISGTPTVTSSAQSYSVTVTDSLGATATANFTLSVVAASAAVSPNQSTIAYGTPSATLTASVAYTGASAPTGHFTFQVDTGTAVTALCAGSSSPLSCSAIYITSLLPVGGHTIIGSMAADMNYAATSGTSTLTVSQTTQTISFTSPASPVTYGGPAIGLSATGGASGNPVTFSIDTGSTATGSISGSTLTVSSVGTLVIDANQAGDTNYVAASEVQRSIVVTQATLVVTADANSMQFGGPVPALTGTLSGVVNGDNITASYAANASSTSPVGNTYTVTPTLIDPGNRLPNYTVDSHTAAFTITAATLTVTAANASRIYGAVNPTLTATYVGEQGSDSFTASANTSATASSPVVSGGYSIVPSVTPNTGTSIANYSVQLVNGRLTITQASAAVAVTQALPLTSGVGIGVITTFTATVTDASTGSSGTPTGSVQFLDNSTSPALILGTVVLNGGTATLSTTFASAGPHPITAVYLGDVDFSGTTSPALNEIVVASSFSVAANPNALTLAYGKSGNAIISFTATGNYAGTVTLSCGSQPAVATCIFSPAIVTLAGDNASLNSQVTITAVKANAVGGVSQSRMWFPVALMLAALVAIRRRIAPGLRPLLLTGLALLVTPWMTGCGSGIHFTGYTGSVNVMVVASATGAAGTSSPSMAQTATIGLTVTEY